MSRAPIPYADDVEQPEPDEEQHIARCIAAMARTQHGTFQAARHGYRATHAKSHGFLRGRLEVHDGLAPELAQGLFAAPGAGAYDVVARISTESNLLDDDRTNNARGFALKVLGVWGETLHPDDPQHDQQDLLFNTLPVLPPGTARKFMELFELRAAHFGDEDAQQAAIDERDDADELGAFGRLPVTDVLACSYYSQGAFRHGAYVAKYALRPGSAEQEALGEVELSEADDPGVLSARLAAWTAEHEVRFDLAVQLRTNAETMPVEDAAVDWPQEESPYVVVGTVTFAPQDPYSPARRTFGDDRLAFRPWHGLAAHRPLGSINRLRRRGYEELGAHRFAANAVEGAEVSSAADLPD